VNTLPVESLANPSKVIGTDACGYRPTGWCPRPEGDLGQYARPARDGHHVERAQKRPEVGHFCGQQVANINGRLRASSIRISLRRIECVCVERWQDLWLELGQDGVEGTNAKWSV
jgi:hypothetical protein